MKVYGSPELKRYAQKLSAAMIADGCEWQVPHGWLGDTRARLFDVKKVDAWMKSKGYEMIADMVAARRLSKAHPYALMGQMSMSLEVGNMTPRPSIKDIKNLYRVAAEVAPEATGGKTEAEFVAGILDIILKHREEGYRAKTS